MDATTVVRRSRRGLSYSRRGSGPCIVLIHGWCLDRTVWLYQEQQLLAAGFEVIAPDLAGYGASADLQARSTWVDHATDVADLIDELDLTATVVGFAFGAVVAMHLPTYDRVRSVVAIGVPSAAGAPYPKMKLAMLRDWPIFAERSAKAICAREHSPAALGWLARIYGSTPLSSALSGADLLAAFEPADHAQTWTVPFLFVHGAEDTVVSPQVSIDAAARYEGAELEIVPESGHFVPWDQPGALSSLIERAARP